MQENALIVFARRPEKGKVKKRLAIAVGDEQALEIYQKLLLYTKAIVSNTLATVFVFTTGCGDDCIWNEYTVFEQCEGNLGERMLAAFTLIFAKGFKHIVIIGSDCVSLSSRLIRDAFDKLNEYDAVIGPATDGGYYLLGMNQIHSALFENKAWGTNALYDSTMKDMYNLQLSCFSLPELNDVDTIEDVPFEWL
jgi:rSAM/selenodomain-associated transferase 1